MNHLQCAKLFPGCPAEIHLETEDQVLTAAAAHAAEVHGLEQLDEPTVAAVRAAISRD